MSTDDPHDFADQDEVSPRRFPNLFTVEEQTLLDRWGEKALAIQRGEWPPQTDKEKRFAAVCSGERAPETKFDQLWLRYVQASEAEDAFRDLARLRNEFESLQEEFSRIKSAHGAVWRHHEEVKSHLEKELARATAREKDLLRTLREYEQRLGINDQKKVSVQDPEPWIDSWREQK